MFQPIWVQDVVAIIIKVLESNIHSKILEIGGEEIFSFKDILELILDELQINRKLIHRFPFQNKWYFFWNDFPKAY